MQFETLKWQNTCQMYEGTTLFTVQTLKNTVLLSKYLVTRYRYSREPRIKPVGKKFIAVNVRYSLDE